MERGRLPRLLTDLTCKGAPGRDLVGPGPNETHLVLGEATVATFCEYLTRGHFGSQ